MSLERFIALPMAPNEPQSPLFEEFSSVRTSEWEAKIREDLGATDVEDALRWSSIDGVSLRGFYRQDDLNDVPHVSESAAYPPLAGANASPANDWRLRQDVWHSDLSAVRELANGAVDGGIADLGLVSSPTTETAEQSVCTAQDLVSLFREGSLGDVTVHVEHGTGAAALFAALTGLDEDLDVHERLGSVGYDPVGALATGTLPPSSGAFRLAGDLLRNAPNDAARMVTADTRLYHNAGASAVQELTYTLGALTETLTRLLQQDLSLSNVLRHLQVTTAVSTSYFVEIAKLRALRLLVPQVVEAFADANGQTVDVTPADVFVQAHTSRRTETRYDPHMNLLRATTEAMAAVIGGSEVITVRPYDARIRPPDRFGTRIARNVQLILKHEAHFDVVADPAAGSYYLERATDQLAQRAWSQFQKLESNGGILAALNEGIVQEEIAETAERRRETIDDRERVLVGTNHYPDLNERLLADLEDLSSCNNGSESVPELDEGSLDRLQDALEGNTSIPTVTDALASGPSCIDALPSIRVADGIEQVRLRTERYATEHDRTPLVFLAPLGPAGPRSARATFARNVFGVAGFEVDKPLKFDTIEEALDAASEASPEIIVLCSSNAEYSRLVPAFRGAISEDETTPLLVVAANPADLNTDLDVDDYIHQGMSLRNTLETFQRRLGILMHSNSTTR